MVENLSALKKFALGQAEIDPSEKNAKLWAVLLVCAIKILARKGGLVSLGHGTGLGKWSDLVSLSDSDLRDLKAFITELIGRFAAVCDGAGVRSMIPELAHMQLEDVWLKTIWSKISRIAIAPSFDDELSLGHVYQFFCLPERKESQKRIEAADKALALGQLIAFTQLYTPRWVVDFLLQNTLLACWSQPENSSLTPRSHHWQYQLQSRAVKSRKEASHLRILDPACGAGHMLLPAVDLLLLLYEMEGFSKQEAMESILKYNLFGADIDTTALAVAKLSLLLKCLNLGISHTLTSPGLILACPLRSEDGLLGSLSRSWNAEHFFNRKFDAVIMNPPYIGRKLLDRKLKDALKALYPHAYNDLYAAFLIRGLELLQPGGRLGAIGQASLLYLPSYEKLRKYLAESTFLVSVVDAGIGVFPLQTGEKVNSILMVAESASDFSYETNPATKFIDLSDPINKMGRLEDLIGAGDSAPDRYSAFADDFQHYRNYAYNYKCPPAVAKLMKSLPTLSSVALVCQGLATTNNSRFLRFWWDVDPSAIGKRWFPYVKGAGRQRWLGAIRTVVDWRNNGQSIKDAVAESYPYLENKVNWVVKNEQYYFRPGLTFSSINSGRFGVRMLPPGCIFDVSGSAVFFEDDDLYFWLAYLNSSVVVALVGALNPTINFQVGDVKNIPLIPLAASVREEITVLSRQCHHLSSYLNSFDPSIFSHDMPGEIRSIAAGADMETVWNDYKKQRRSAIDQLSELQLRIDLLIDQSLLENIQGWGWTISDLNDFRRWVEEVNGNGYEQFGGPITEDEFARLALHELTSAVLPLSLPMSDNQAIADQIRLKKNQVVWLQDILQTSIANYVQEEFAFDQLKFYERSPRFFCLSFPEDREIQLFSSSHVRANCGTSAIRKNLSKLALYASSIDDWTGVDLARIIESKYQLLLS